MTRTPLPGRRPNITETAEYRGQPIAITVGFDLDGTPREVFANGAKEGSDMQHTLCDSCIIISIALQSGIEATALSRHLGTIPGWVNGKEGEVPASPLGVIMGIVVSAAGIASAA